MQLATKIVTILFLCSLVACTSQKIKTTRSPDNVEARIAVKTFSVGFQKMSERYVEEISAAELAKEGLRGLTTIDPTIRIEENSDKISIESDSIQKHLYDLPRKDDHDGWANLIVNAIYDSRSDSDVFKKTRMVRFYEAIFDGSLSLLDPFSRYANEKRARKNREKRSGFGEAVIR